MRQFFRLDERFWKILANVWTLLAMIFFIIDFLSFGKYNELENILRFSGRRL